MQPSSYERLKQLPPLGSNQTDLATNPPCKICGEKTVFFDVVDFNKICAANIYHFGPARIPVYYFRCTGCYFLFTDFFDDWNEKDFAAFIYNDDYVKVDQHYVSFRPTKLAAAYSSVLAQYKDANILDYGSGGGIFVNKMRESGFSRIQGYDPYSQPTRPPGLFDVVTCFEVVEHSPNPLNTFADIKTFLSPQGVANVQTSIQPDDIDVVRANWWYVGPRNGHVSIFTREALSHAARAKGMQLLLDANNGFWFCREDADLRALREGPLRLTPTYSLTLRAPAAPQATGWNGAERMGAQLFRWTADSPVSWQLSLPNCPCLVTVRIPVVNAVEPTFSSKCTAVLRGVQVPLRYLNFALYGTFRIEKGYEQESENVLQLVTPKPLRPCDIRESGDQRTLGLAIIAGE